MNTLTTTAQRAYRRFVWCVDCARAAVIAIVGSVLGREWTHSTVYTAEYYREFIEGPAMASSTFIAESIVRDLCPATVLDVGCGTGALLEALRNRGCRVRGLEFGKFALACCRERGLDVASFDLRQDSRMPGLASVVASMEVAEHLPGDCADRFVDLLCAASEWVVMTAAVPGQGGTDHLNEQPPEYWIQKFEARGYGLRPELVEQWKSEWREGGVQDWYYNNLLVFRKRG